MKAIFFDFDGVMTPDVAGSFSICKNIERLAGIPFEVVQPIYRRLHKPVQMGEQTMDALWQTLVNELGQDLPRTTFDQALYEIHRNESMFALVQELNSVVPCIGMITDNARERFALIRKHQPEIDELFSPIVLSAEVHAKKDNPEIFYTALARAQVGAQESIFIDNHEHNLDVPREMGFAVYHHDHEKNNMAALRAFLRDNNVNV